MATLKFRAYDKATKDHWNPPPQGFIEFDIYNVPDFIGNTFNENGEWERRFTIVRLTSRKDKNGACICEGDIVDYDGEWIDFVEIDEDGQLWIASELAHTVNSLNMDCISVIGNIHHHKHLLEETL